MKLWVYTEKPLVSIKMIRRTDCSVRYRFIYIIAVTEDCATIY